MPRFDLAETSVRRNPRLSDVRSRAKFPVEDMAGGIATLRLEDLSGYKLGCTSGAAAPPMSDNFRMPVTRPLVTRLVSVRSGGFGRSKSRESAQPPRRQGRVDYGRPRFHVCRVRQIRPSKAQAVFEESNVNTKTNRPGPHLTVTWMHLVAPTRGGRFGAAGLSYVAFLCFDDPRRLTGQNIQTRRGVSMV